MSELDLKRGGPARLQIGGQDVRGLVRGVFNTHVFTPYGRCAVDPADCGYEFEIDDWDAWAGHVSEVIAATIEEAAGLSVPLNKEKPQ